MNNYYNICRKTRLDDILYQLISLKHTKPSTLKIFVFLGVEIVEKAIGNEVK